MDFGALVTRLMLVVLLAGAALAAVMGLLIWGIAYLCHHITIGWV